MRPARYLSNIQLSNSRVFRIEGLDLKAYAGEEIGLVALLDYEWDIIMDWFTVQE